MCLRRLFLRMHPSTVRVAACVIVLVSWSPAAAAGQLPESLDASVAGIAERELRSYAASGAAIAVTDGEDVRVYTIGRARHDGTDPVRPEQPFGTVDFGDVLTAFAAVLLAGEGELELEAPIGRYAPDLPRRLSSLTFTQLLSHTAGLDDAEELPPRRRPVSVVWPNATDGALFTEPGAIHSPSRIGTALAHALLAYRTGHSAEGLVERLIVAPAGLERTTFDPARAWSLDAVPGYVVSTSGAAPQRALTPADNPRRQLYASAGDVAELLRLWMQGGGDVWPASAVSTMLAPRALRPAQPGDSIGFGMVVTRAHGRRELTYSAGEAGYGVHVRVVPAAGIGLVVLANATRAVLLRTADELLEQLVPGTEKAAEGSGDAPADLPSQPADYAGTYANGDRFVALELRDGELHWRDGDLMLPVRRDGAVLEAYVADGRVAQRFRWTRDDAGRAYVLVEERAYRRTEPPR